MSDSPDSEEQEANNPYYMYSDPDTLDTVDPYHCTSGWERQPREQSPTTEELMMGAAEHIEAQATAAAEPVETEAMETESHDEQPDNQVPMVSGTVYDGIFTPSFPLDPALRTGDITRVRQQGYLPQQLWQVPLLASNEVHAYTAPPVVTTWNPLPVAPYTSPYPVVPYASPYPAAAVGGLPMWSPAPAPQHQAAYPTGPTVTAWSATPTSAPSRPQGPAQPTPGAATPLAAVGPATAAPAAATGAADATAAAARPRVRLSGAALDAARNIHCLSPGCGARFVRVPAMREHVRKFHPELQDVLEVATGRR